MSKLIIPTEALNQHIAAIGKTGSGKTYAMKGVVEHLLTLGLIERRQGRVNQGMRDKEGAVKAPEVLIINGPSFTSKETTKPLFGATA